MMRRGFVERRLQIVAQCGGQRGFVTGLHRDGIDQRREQSLASRVQQIAERLHFGGEALHFALGLVQRLARIRFRALPLLPVWRAPRRRHCAPSRPRHALVRSLRRRREPSGASFARASAASSRASASVSCCALDSASAAETSRARSWLDFAGIPFGEFRRQPLERALGFAQRFVQGCGSSFRGVKFVARIRAVPTSGSATSSPSVGNAASASLSRFLSRSMSCAVCAMRWRSRCAASRARASSASSVSRSSTRRCSAAERSASRCRSGGSSVAAFACAVDAVAARDGALSTRAVAAACSSSAAPRRSSAAVQRR